MVFPPIHHINKKKVWMFLWWGGITSIGWIWLLVGLNFFVCWVCVCRFDLCVGWWIPVFGSGMVVLLVCNCNCWVCLLVFLLHTCMVFRLLCSNSCKWFLLSLHLFLGLCFYILGMLVYVFPFFSCWFSLPLSYY